MKTRSGENVALQDVLDEAIARARKIIDEKNPEMPEPEKAETARIIGIGAAKYADLSQYRMTDYIFSWDRMLVLPRQHRALPAKRLRPHPIHLPQSRRRIRRPGRNHRSPSPPKKISRNASANSPKSSLPS